MSVVYQYEQPPELNGQQPGAAGFRKKIILVGVLGVAMIVTMILVAVFGAKKNVENADNQQGVAREADAKASAVVALNALGDNNFFKFKELVHPDSPMAHASERHFQTLEPQRKAYAKCNVRSDEKAVELTEAQQNQVATVQLICGEDAAAMELRLDSSSNEWKFYIIA